jgi:hypothetical protein
MFTRFRKFLNAKSDDANVQDGTMQDEATDSQTQKSPVAAPKAVRKTTPKKPMFAKPAKTADILDVFPADMNLLGKNPMEIELDGTKHFIAFRNEHIILDGHNFQLANAMTSFDIEDVKKQGKLLSITASANGKKQTLTFDESDWEALLHALLTHGAGTHDPTSIVITRF